MNKEANAMMCARTAAVQAPRWEGLGEMAATTILEESDFALAGLLQMLLLHLTGSKRQD